MRPHFATISPLVLALLIVGQSTSRAATVPGHAPYVADELIVVFHDDTSGPARRAVHDGLGARAVQALVHPRMDLVTFAEGADLDQLAAAYMSRPDVESAERNWIGEGGGGVVPADTWYSQQWQLNNTGQSGGTAGADMEAESGWVYSTGSTSIKVAILDSGIDSDHAEFAGRILAGFDYVNSDADPEDDHGHGTWVAGNLGANANNNFSVAGVDQNCKIVPVKVLDAFNAGTTANLINGLGFSTTQDVDVISMSLINYPCSVALINALRDAKLAGAILVACAGNGGIGNADVSCPGASTHTISIGAADHNDWRASYSGTGAALEFMSGGHLAVTVEPFSAVDTYNLFNGCSSATPLAAGIVSILRGVAADLGIVLLTADVRTLLQAGAEDQVGNPAEDTPGRDNFMGWGRLNLRLMLENFFSITAAPVIAARGGLNLQAAPNPFPGNVELRFALPTASWVKVSLVDVGGRAVRSLNDAPMSAGPHALSWDGTDADGHPVAAGVLFARVEAAGTSALQKVTLIR